MCAERRLAARLASFLSSHSAIIVLLEGRGDEVVAFAAAGLGAAAGLDAALLALALLLMAVFKFGDLFLDGDGEEGLPDESDEPTETSAETLPDFTD